MTTTTPAKTAANRPSRVPKHTRTTEAKRESDLDTGVRVSIDGEVYEARIGDVTPQIARELRKGSGMGFMSLMEAMADDPDIDVISSFVWLARRIRGEDVDHDTVEVSYTAILSDGFEVEVAGAEEIAGDDPES